MANAAVVYLHRKFGATLPFLLDRFALHAAGQTFLVPAVLAAVSLAFVYRTVFILPARVRQVLAYRSLEESFASLAAGREEEQGVHARTVGCVIRMCVRSER